jgi:hypothetical protein
MSAGKFVTHIKSHGHKWVTGLTAVVFVIYLIFVLKTGTTMNQAIASAVVTIVAALTVFGGVLSLIVVAGTADEDLGALKELKQQLTLGLLVGVAVSIFGILNSFGLLKQEAQSAPSIAVQSR